jgi:predicted PurR-regulated permease PerM
MRHLAATTAIVLATLAGLAVLWELRGAVLIFFLSLGTSAALRPAIERLHAWGLPKSLALALTYLGCIVAFAGLALALVFPLAADVQKLGHDFKDAYQRVSDTWAAGNPVQRAIAARLPSWDDLEHISWGVNSAGLIETDSAAEKETAALGPTGWWTPNAVQTVLGATWGFFGTLLNVLIIVVLSLYWSIDRVHFERLWLSLLDVQKRQRARDTWRAVEQATGAYLQREAVQSLAAGLMLGAGFWLFGQPYPVLSAAIGALAWLIPWVGAPVAMVCVTAIWLPTFFLAGGALPISLLAAGLYTLLVLLLLEWLVEPRLFQRRRYDPILLVVVAVGMVDWLGLLGLLLAPPVAATIQIVGGQYLARRTTPAADATSLANLAERVATLQARLADAGDVPDETGAAAARLEALVQRARGMLDSKIVTPRAPVARGS